MRESVSCLIKIVVVSSSLKIHERTSVFENVLLIDSECCKLFRKIKLAFILYHQRFIIDDSGVPQFRNKGSTILRRLPTHHLDIL